VDIDREAIGVARLGQQRTCQLGVVVVDHGGVLGTTELYRVARHVDDAAVTREQTIDELVLVDRVRHGLAHSGIGEEVAAATSGGIERHEPDSQYVGGFWSSAVTEGPSLVG